MKRIISYFTLLIMITSALVFSSCALGDETRAVTDEFISQNGRTLCVSDRGDCEGYPENTVEGILSSHEQGADIVLCNVSVTKDSVPVLLDSSNASAMFSKDVGDISSVNYADIAGIKLRLAHGGGARDITDKTVDTLSDALKKTKNTVLMLDVDERNLDVVYDTVKKENRIGSVIFYVGHIKPDTLKSFISSKSEKPLVMTYFKGNVIFSAVSYVKSSLEAGAYGICLATNNPYGVIFGKTVMGKFTSGARAMAMLSRPEICGNIRRDNATWYSDLISRGYNMILTNEPKALKEYIKQADEAKKKLETAYADMCENYTLPVYKASAYRDYKKAYADAKAKAESVIADNSPALSDIISAQSELKYAYDNIQNDADLLKNGTAGVTITVPRIITAVLVVAGITAGEVFIAKHTKKKNSSKNKSDIKGEKS